MKPVPRSIVLSVIALAGVASISAQVAERPATHRPSTHAVYAPTRDHWETRAPADVGMDAALLKQAVEYAKTRDTNWGKSDYMADQIRTFGRPLGKVPPSHGPTNGVILRHGYIVAEFGDTSVVEPTYSVAKSYLSTILGLTIDRKMIKSIVDPVRDYVRDGGYDSPHNALITWQDHARQASEWEGTMFDKPSTFSGHEE